MKWKEIINLENEEIINKLLENVNPSWLVFFNNNQMKEIFNSVINEIRCEVELFDEHLEIFPSPNLVFNAIKDLSPKDIKVIILGQDPYHQPNQAMGLSFSVPENIKIHPSLVNIYKELSTDIDGWDSPKHGNLTKWTDEKVLLLNSSLTVLQSKPMRHMKHWKPITDKIIEFISEMPQTKVFMLWGNSSKVKKNYIKNNNKNHILEANHPSPLSANRGGWFGCKHFSRCNEILTENKVKPINWILN